MKKFLSLLLAVLMVVSAVPFFVFSAAAVDEGEAGAAAEEESFPELIITEIYANSINYCQNAATWLADWPEEVGFYSAPQPGVSYFRGKSFSTGASLGSGIYKKTTAADGTVTFVSATGTAEAGVEYYDLVSSSEQYDNYQYIEVYNSGTEPIDLYDYKLAYDSSDSYEETYDTDSPIKFMEIKAGGVQSSLHMGFERIKLAEGTALSSGDTQYYTKSGNSFIPCAAGTTAVSGTEYYRKMADGGEYFVTNPETAILQPGQCAVLWFYTQIDNRCGAKTEYFRQYFEYNSASAENKLDMSDVLILGIESNNEGNNCGYSSAVNAGFKIALDGQKRYGIVKKDYGLLYDNNFDTQWVSSVRWENYAGYNDAKTATTASVVAGVTTVTSGYFIKDSVTGYYILPTAGTDETIANGTASADKNGKALEGVVYYTLKLSNSNLAPSSGQEPVSHKLDRTSVNYIYGFDSNSSLTDGTAYTVSDYGVTPGFLTEVQKAVLPNGTQETSVPKLVITEVVPDNTGKDAYEYVEVVNTSGSVINIFDYSFVARGSSYMTNSVNEFFNKFNPLIPGDYGNILAAEPGAIYYDVAPTNITYEEGWLEPGEVVVLWSYFAESAQIGATFDDFYAYYGLDRSVKVIAMDSDNSTYSGRTQRQNLGNNGSYIYGLVANENLEYYGDMYTSNAIMKPVVYSSGCVSANNYGISISDAECFVLAASIFATCSNVGGGLGEDYGYQYIWTENKGLNNKCGAYYTYARLTRWGSETSFSFTGSVVTEEWKASPGTLLPRQKTALTTNHGSGRYVLYMQDFEGLGSVSGYENVAALLGISAVSADQNSTMSTAHTANVTATEVGENSLLAIKDGKLYITNQGEADEYLILMSDAILDSYRQTNFTIEYSMTYGAELTGNGYSGVLFDFNAKTNSYGAPILRLNGTGSSSVYLNGVEYSVEDSASTEHAAPTMAGDTLYERLFPASPADESAEAAGTAESSFAGVQLNVRIEVSFNNGVTVYVNDVEVSETKRAASSEAFANWAFFAEEGEGSDLALVTTPGVSVAYDYIMVYSDTLGTNADDMDFSSLYITELFMGGGSYIYKSGATSNTDLNWIEYIEITNGGTEPVSLADYSLIRTGCSYSGDSGCLVTTDAHVGNNYTWGKNSNYAVAKLSDWLGTGDDRMRFFLSGSNSIYLENPSANEAVLQPGESVLVLTLNTGSSVDDYKKEDKSGNNVDTITAFRSWLNLTDDVMVIATAQANVKKKIGNGNRTYNIPENSGFCMWDNESFTYGIGKNTVTYADGTTKTLTKTDWGEIYTHDYRKLDSIVDHTMSISVGQNNVTLNSGDVGMGGKSLVGFAAHFLYGNDNSVNYKYGTVMTRCVTKVMSTYKSGSSTVDSKGEYNAGKLFSIQQDCFRQLRKLQTSGYKQDATLVITEYIPNTNTDRGTEYDGFESMEITNIGSSAVNLYDYALVRSSSTTFGGANTWNVMNLLTPGAVVGRYHPWYDRLKDISNPATCVVEPGESVVIWFYMANTYDLADVAPVRDYVSVEDYRQYWADNGNTLLTEKDENGEYKVKVIVVDASEKQVFSPTFNLANSGHATYGICTKNAISASKSCRGADVISYVTCSVESMAWDLSVQRVALKSDSYAYTAAWLKLSDWLSHPELVEVADLGKVLYTGDSAKGYFKLTADKKSIVACGDDETVTKGTTYYYVDVNGSYVRAYVNEDLSVSNYCTKDALGNYSFAEGTHASYSYEKQTVEVGTSVAGMYVSRYDYTYTACAAGALAADGVTYYALAENVYTAVTDVEAGVTDVSLYYTRSTGDQYFVACGAEDVAVEGEEYYARVYPTYYQLFYYTNIQVVNDVANGSYNFVYGISATSGSSIGAVLQTTKTTSRTRLNAEATKDNCVTLTKENLIPYVSATIASRGVREPSLGYLIEEQLGMVAATNGFTEAAVLADGTKVYLYRTVDQLSDVAIEMLGASIGRSEEGTTVTFSAAISAEVYEQLKARFGADNVSFGMLTARVETLLHSGANLRELELAGAYTPVTGLSTVTRLDDLYVKSTRPVYTKCADGAYAVEGITYYSYDSESDTYSEVTEIELGSSVADYYLRGKEYAYDSCKPEVLAAENTDYYAYTDGEYVAVENVEAGVTDVYYYYTKAVLFRYVACAADAVVEAGVTYYIPEGDVYVVDFSLTGEPAYGLYVREYYDVYTSCKVPVLAKTFTNYYSYVPATDEYVKVTNITTGTTDVAEYFTQSTVYFYTKCEAGARVVPNTSYYELGEDGETYSKVMGLTEPGSVEDYYTRSEEPCFVACEDGVASANTVYYKENANGNYYVAYGVRVVSGVDGYYVKTGDTYTACVPGALAVTGTVYYTVTGVTYVDVTDQLTPACGLTGLYKLVDDAYVRCEDGSAYAEGDTERYYRCDDVYSAVSGLKTVDSVAEYYKLVDGEYVQCGADELAYSDVTYYQKAAGYHLDENMTGEVRDGKLVFTATPMTMPRGYYSDTFTCIAYVKICIEGKEIYIYADTALNRTTKQVMLSAMLDVSEVQTAEYCYEVGDGTYSRYTAAQRAQFEKICAE